MLYFQYLAMINLHARAGSLQLKWEKKMICIVRAMLAMVLLIGCSAASISDGQYTYRGIGFESPERTAKAYVLVKDADTRQMATDGMLDIQRAGSLTQLELQRQLIECLKAKDYECVNALGMMGVGIGGGYGWGWGAFMPHTQSDRTFYQ